MSALGNDFASFTIPTRHGPYDVSKCATLVAVSDELLTESIAFHAWSFIAQDMLDAELDRQHGPRLGPGRREYSAVMAPVWRRERIRSNVRRVVGSRRPGAFVRAA